MVDEARTGGGAGWGFWVVTVVWHWFLLRGRVSIPMGPIERLCAWLFGGRGGRDNGGGGGEGD